MKLISTPVTKPPAPLLPVEIISQIISYIDPSDQTLFYSCCLVNRSWYSAAIGHLYARPRLTSKNYDKFTRTLCPPVHSHVRYVDLAALVRRLDMSSLVYSSSKSLTARLLRRVRPSLEIFVADATSFSINSFAPLSKCYKLREVNLVLVASTENHEPIIDALTELKYLTKLRMPRFGVEKPRLQAGFLNLLPSLRLLDIPQESLFQGISGTELKPHGLRELEIYYGRRHSQKVMMMLPTLVERLSELYQITFMGQMDSADIYDDVDEAIADDVDAALKAHGELMNAKGQTPKLPEVDMGIFWEDI